MGNDIEIRVRVANNTASGLAAVNRSLSSLRDQARDAGRGLDGLTERAAAASLALRALKDSAQDASRALRSLNTAARTADTRMGAMSDRSRTLRRDTDDLDGSMRRLTTTVGGLRGSNGRLTVSTNDSGNGMDNLRKAAMMLAPALIPIAASAVPIAANLTAAGAGVAAFGLAIAGQLVAVKGASDAQQKYSDAVKKHGAASKEAGQAEALYLDQVQNMDPATRKAAAALSVLKDQYKDWSKSLAGDTMPVFTKGLAVAGGLLPKLTPAVKGASEQLSRLMTILAGGVNSGGFSKFMDSFAKFSTGALSKANDALVHFMRTMSGTGSAGAGAGKLSEFMDYVRKAGPQVGDTLLHLSEALVHVVVAASDTGLSMLTFVNAIAKLVDAIPTGVLSTFLQFAVALKAVRIAAAGLSALSGLSGLGASLAGLVRTSAQAGGGLRGLAAAFGTLSRSAKVALVGSGIGILVIALTSLSEIGKKAPPDIDRMTTAISELGDTGKVTGEALRVFGADLGGLGESLRTLSRPSNLDKTQQFLTSLIGMDSTPVAKAKENLDAVDKALANMVRGGKTKLAAEAFKDIAKAMEKQGLTSKELRGKLDDYKSALADQALEAKLTAQSQGVFGEQALKVSAQLDTQKASADGLRQSLQALNDVNRQGLGGMIGFEAAIDAAAKAAKDNAGALSMTNGVLNLGSEKARNAASALQDLADKTDAAAASARESGSSWETVNGIYSRGRSALIKNAEAMGLSKDQAAQLASQILKIPDKTATIKMNDEDARAGLNAFNAAVKKTPGSKSVTLKTLSSSAEAVLEAFGYKVTHLKDGSVRITAKTGGALSGIRNVAGAIAALHDKTVTLTSIHNIITRSQTYRSVHDIVGATGGLFTGKGFRYAEGGLVQGPGTGTSDDVPAPWLSNGEFVVRKAAVDKYGEAFLQRINDGQYEGGRYARGGKVKLTKAQQRAKAQAQAEEQARHDAMGQLSISHFGRMAGYRRNEFENALGRPDSTKSLVDALNQWRSTIQKATHGRTESRLLKQLDSAGKSLLKWEKQLTSVTANLSKAKDKLADLKNAAAQLRDSVKSNLLSSANITRGAGPDSTVTLSSIRSGMRMSRDKVTAFAAALKQLKAKGFSRSIIQQVAEAGIDGGGLETAGALLQASASEVKSINETQAQIEKAAGQAGKTTADAVYEKAIKAQEKYVRRLEEQQKKLQKAMEKLADKIEKAIEKAFKHGGKASGGIVGAAASGGLRSSLTWVGEQGPELLDLPAGARVWSNPDSRRKLAAGQAPWSSMLTSPRRAPAAAAAGGGGQQQVVVLEIRAGDSSRYSEFLVAELRKAVKVRGSIEATFAPPRGR